MMMEKTDEQIERERAAVAAMSNAKANMTASLERIATLERALSSAKCSIATLKGFIPPSGLVQLSRDESHIALWKAIEAITLGNKTDDKLIVENLRAQGVWLHRFKGCDNHPERAILENLDGDDLCQECCDNWARAEGGLPPLTAAPSTAGEGLSAQPAPVEGVREALEPVWHWYQSDEHPERPLAEIVADVVADLQQDRAWVLNPPEHNFWMPGEADCPREIKAGNGELHTLRCKVCGLDNPRDQRCLSRRPPIADEVAQPAPVEGVFKLGDRVTKTKGSSWTGRVVGTYSTTLTPEGYAVESENEPGSVQIYPAAALHPNTESGRSSVAPDKERAALREAIKDFRDRSRTCRTNLDAYCEKAAAVWEMAAAELEAKYAGL